MELILEKCLKNYVPSLRLQITNFKASFLLKAR